MSILDDLLERERLQRRRTAALELPARRPGVTVLATGSLRFHAPAPPLVIETGPLSSEPGAHRLDTLVHSIGRPDDATIPQVTARLQLLLDSRPLSGRTAHARALDAIVDAYWRAGRPQFIVDDVVRHWKALCVARADGPRLDHLRLRFDGLWLCFNGLAFLLLGESPGHITRAHARRLADLTPAERMQEVADTAYAVDTLLEDYAWFLEHTDADEPRVLSWVARDANYAAALDRAASFADEMFDLLLVLGERSGMTRQLLL